MNSDSGSAEPSTDDVLIEYVKEKDNLRIDLKQKDAEIQKYKAKVYDLHERIKTLEEEKKELAAANAALLSRELPVNNKPSSNVPPNKLGVVRPRTAAGGRSPMLSRPKTAGRGRGKPASNATSKKATNNVQVKSELPSPAAEIDPKKYKEAVDRIAHLNEIAEKFPELKLSVVFTSEKFFKEGDINNDGTIDCEELEALLTKQGHLYTNKELKDIMGQIDVDNTGTIDIMEYLAVMERVQQRKRVNLPQALTRSSACIVQ
ncbi:uncharacterized protein LOC100178497 [Ciona intestinalis]